MLPAVFWRKGNFWGFGLRVAVFNPAFGVWPSSARLVHFLSCDKKRTKETPSRENLRFSLENPNPVRALLLPELSAPNSHRGKCAAHRPQGRRELCSPLPLGRQRYPCGWGTTVPRRDLWGPASGGGWIRMNNSPTERSSNHMEPPSQGGGEVERGRELRRLRWARPLSAGRKAQESRQQPKSVQPIFPCSHPPPQAGPHRPPCRTVVRQRHR